MQSFLQPDITVFRQNLSALEEINSRWRLYQKPVFTQNLIIHFLTVLLDVLVANSHALLREEMTTCVYHMASVDMDVFFTQFLPQFVDGQTDIDQGQKTVLKSSFKNDTVSHHQTMYLSFAHYFKI